MDKILQTQLTNIYNHINAQEEEIEMAARLIAQAVSSEGEVRLATFHDFTGIQSYLLEGALSLPKAQPFETVESLDAPDRTLVIADQFDESVKQLVNALEEAGKEFVLISNYNKHEAEILDSLHHYIDLSSPRPLVPTPDFDKIVNPYISAFLYLYDHLFVLVDEMTNEAY